MTIMRRWQGDGRLYAINELGDINAYVVTTDATMIGKIGWHKNRLSTISVEYISASDAKAWDDV